MTWLDVLQSCELNEDTKLIFIGGGNMAGALIRRAVNSNFLTKDDIVISVKSKGSQTKWIDEGYNNTFLDNNDMLKKYPTGIVFICVKPQLFGSMVDQLEEGILQDSPLVVSIMAGLSTQSIAEKLHSTLYSQSIVRLMPSTPCLVGASASLVCYNQLPENNRLSIVTELASHAGTCTILDEKQFHAASAVAACSPAYVYILIEALADGGVLAGLPRNEALTLAAQAFQGAAKMVAETGKHPGLLKDEVCSAGGATVAGVRLLEKNGVRSALIEAVKASTERSEEMSKIK
ncbi:hypothetical protein PFISCL1PPCAC_15356 [Pristionchus fissidentatus]|uniref:Pyrroline-5-carboxylate reductase n=1 Tax=Pristionchus fissidentatus TaxID=1538716 RepID=A0AAV5W053_9BILA|nr:hypothetical protein PFISCL1PPCAC_15356 [Pristionchus fissidentatus]